MEMALYQPGLGYYMAGARKFGAEGDFITSPEVSTLFSDCLATQCQQVLEQIETAACVLEFGAGSGRMAADILARLEQLESLPDHYYILELSPELQQRQRQTIKDSVPHLLASVKWLDSLDGLELHGIVIANEVLDAMPVRRFRLNQDGNKELGVSYKNERFCWAEIEPDQMLKERLSDISVDLPNNYESELNPAVDGWMASVSSVLAKGAAVLIDYGYVAQEYYHPERREGTLIGHYRHHLIEDPFVYPGLQDLSASVDFTAVADAGEQAGLDLDGFTSQALFLMSLGLDQFYAERTTESSIDRLKMAQQIKTLTLPAEMGERFQVIGFTKSLDLPLRGFSLRNQLHRL
jgi:SAM-dependent MidA family methyltransferase